MFFLDFNDVFVDDFGYYNCKFFLKKKIIFCLGRINFMLI